MCNALKAIVLSQPFWSPWHQPGMVLTSQPPFGPSLPESPAASSLHAGAWFLGSHCLGHRTWPPRPRGCSPELFPRSPQTSPPHSGSLGSHRWKRHDMDSIWCKVNSGWSSKNASSFLKRWVFPKGILYSVLAAMFSTPVSRFCFPKVDKTGHIHIFTPLGKQVLL